MMRLRTTLKSLSAKRTFFEEQIDYYNQYVKTCLDNLATKTAKYVPPAVVHKNIWSTQLCRDSLRHVMIVIVVAVARKRKPSSSGKDEKKARVKGTVKYSGAKLYEKGVVLEIENLTPDQ